MRRDNFRRNTEEQRCNPRSFVSQYILGVGLAWFLIFPPTLEVAPPEGGTPLVRISHVIETHLTPYARNPDVLPEISSSVYAMSEEYNIPYQLIVGIILKENTTLVPHARGGLGEYGLMQIMPFHVGRFEECGENIEDIYTNICYGVNIFQEHLAFCDGELRCGLLGYNGCVTGPYCFRYPDDVKNHATNVYSTETRLLYEIYSYTRHSRWSIPSRYRAEQ